MFLHGGRSFASIHAQTQASAGNVPGGWSITSFHSVLEAPISPEICSGRRLMTERLKIAQRCVPVQKLEGDTNGVLERIVCWR